MHERDFTPIVIEIKNNIENRLFEWLDIKNIENFTVESNGSI